MKNDISTREDIENFVNTFYTKVKADSLIGPIFIDIVADRWEHHLPKMYSFWASILLNEQSYEGNPMLKHIAISKEVNLSAQHFERWLLLFDMTIDLLFEGAKADEAKLRAANIARLMLHKIEVANLS